VHTGKTCVRYLQVVDFIITTSCRDGQSAGVGIVNFDTVLKIRVTGTGEPEVPVIVHDESIVPVRVPDDYLPTTVDEGDGVLGGTLEVEQVEAPVFTGLDTDNISRLDIEPISIDIVLFRSDGMVAVTVGGGRWWGRGSFSLYSYFHLVTGLRTIVICNCKTKLIIPFLHICDF